MPDVTLRAFEKSDIPHLHRWMNDPESIVLIGRAPRNLEDVERQVEKQRSSGDLLLAIQNGKSELLGWVFLYKIEQEHGRAEIGILLAPESRGKGVGRLAMNMMLEIAFNQLRLHRVYLTTRGINRRGIALYQKLGFSIEGHLREHAFVQGEFYDTVFMGILSREWKEKTARKPVPSMETLDGELQKSDLCPN
jgi:RimJ/RimL family protein N-acetyltransferase